MNHELLVSSGANADIIAAYEWYEKRVPGLGTDLVWRVDAALLLIQRSPQIFRLRRGKMRMAMTTRFPYAIYFVWEAPAKSSVPETSKVRFENDRTRDIEYHTNAGKNICGLGLHSNPAHVFIMLTDAKLRVITPERKETIEDSKAGEVGWEPAVTHRAENITGSNAGCYLIEFKDKDWKPSTGLTK